MIVKSRVERPILFQGWSVRAILDGVKTQTRRVIKPQPRWEESTSQWLWWANAGTLLSWRNGVRHPEMPSECKLGVPGDSLWVRETFSRELWHAASVIVYRADCPNGEYIEPFDNRRLRWIPSIFMPHWVSRIDLVIEDVRVERLQDITDEDTDAEIFGGGHAHGPYCAGGECHCGDFYVQELFGQWWDDINAKPRPVKRAGEVVAWASYPWSLATFLERYGGKVHQLEEGAWSYRPGSVKRPIVRDEFRPLTIHENPWVWVVEFKAVEGAKHDR